MVRLFKMARVSLHFSSSRGIQLDLSRPYPLHENFSPSRGIYRLNLLIDLIFTVYFEEIKFFPGFSSFLKWWDFLPISPHLMGSRLFKTFLKWFKYFLPLFIVSIYLFNAISLQGYILLILGMMWNWLHSNRSGLLLTWIFFSGL